VMCLRPDLHAKSTPGTLFRIAKVLSTNEQCEREG
jgi:hypothetical protein